MGYYKMGQACLNGHQITGDATSNLASNFCGTCGEATITTCPSCKATIRGKYYVENVIGFSGWELANHCWGCGKAYPWTQAKLDAVQELADAIEELTPHEREVIVELMPHLVQETPRTKPAGFKVATILGKMTGPGRAALRDLLNDIVVEAGKTALGF